MSDAAAAHPDHLATRQLDAYNRHDIDAFCACFAEEVEAFELPTMKPLFKGRAALRERYGPYFATQRPAASLVVPRITMASFAIDTEHVVLADGSTLGAIALYHVEGDTIARVWFIRAAR